MSKAAVFNLINTDAELRTMGLDLGATYLWGSLDTPQPRPFVILQWGQQLPGISWESEPGPRDLVIWVHDKPGDYERIDLMHNRIKTLLTNAAHVEGIDDYTLTQVDFRGFGADLRDDGHGTFTRTGSYTVVSRVTA